MVIRGFFRLYRLLIIIRNSVLTQSVKQNEGFTKIKCAKFRCHDV